MRKIAILVLCICLSGCGTVKKMLKQEPKEETSQTVLKDEKAALSKSIPGSAYGVLKTPSTFLPSYRDMGGPHLKIDSLNAVILLGEQTLSDIKRYTQSQSTENYVQSGASDSSGKTGKDVPRKAIARYYATKYQANDLLGDQINPEKAQNQSHFKGIFDQYGNLLSLEFHGEQEADSPSEEKLAFLYASYWDILYNKRVNYIDNDGNRPSPHVKVFADPAKIVHRIDYLGNNKKVIAKGTFTYGVKHMILEQRIVFPKGGKLTDLHPDFFYRQYDRIEAGWVIKCLYEQKDKLSDLIIMQDNGVIFYRYRFNHESIRNQRVIEAFVYNSAEEVVGRYELYFDENGDLQKKILISNDREITGYSIYNVDLEKLKIIVNNYDQSGKHISRIYRDL